MAAMRPVSHTASSSRRKAGTVIELQDDNFSSSDDDAEEDDIEGGILPLTKQKELSSFAQKNSIPSTIRVKHPGRHSAYAGFLNHTHKREELLDYEEVFPLLESGDMILWNSKGCFSDCIKWMSWSNFCHVGMIYRHNEADRSFIYVWESVKYGNGVTDVLTNTKKCGVRLVDLYTLLRHKPCFYIGVVKLHWPDSLVKEAAMRRFAEFRSREHHKAYETNWWTLTRLVVDCFCIGRNSIDVAEFFCSELIAETYKYMGVLPPSFNSSDCMPNDFFDTDFQFQHGVEVDCLMYVGTPFDDI
jgi:hypothetical protein